jgi:hypothetical protein
MPNAMRCEAYDQEGDEHPPCCLARKVTIGSRHPDPHRCDVDGGKCDRDQERLPPSKALQDKHDHDSDKAPGQRVL